MFETELEVSDFALFLGMS